MHLSVRRFLCAITLAAVVLQSSAAVRANENGLIEIERLQTILADVADNVRPSVVAIRSYRRLSSGHATKPAKTPSHQASLNNKRDTLVPAVGSGVIISADGLILTNEHVIHGATPDAIECLLSTGERYTVQGITSDPRSDLGLVRLDCVYPSCPVVWCVGNSNALAR